HNVYRDVEINLILSNLITINLKSKLIQNETYKSIKAIGYEVVITRIAGRIIESDFVLLALGRSGNTKGINLDKIGVDYDPQRVLVTVNDNYHNTQENISAVGDVIGFPSLASSAFNQDRCADPYIIYGSCN
ncbi:FAD-dependent oxidoreductase, partial [Francisella tularensis]|nr:FAD-dependent oxidoreductase [Francisella tularensis]